MIRVAFLATLLAILVGCGLVLIPATVMVVNGTVATNCGRACLDPGVTENPYITLIGGER